LTGENILTGSANKYTVKEFFEDNKDELGLELLTSTIQGQLDITVCYIYRPAFVLTGFMENYLNKRIQIIGETEMLYISSLDKAQKREAFQRLFSKPLCCIIVSKGLDIPDGFIEKAEKFSVPVMRTNWQTTVFIQTLTEILNYHFAPRTTVHGSLVDVYGVGLLFSGPSGIGKSEIVLDLVDRGHRLVADDVVEIIKRGDMIIGRGKEHLRHFMEVRGVGIINIMDVFGIRSIRIQKRIEVKVQLREWDPKRDWDRHGLDEKYTEILGTKITQLFIPIFPGKNITVIAETIALNHMLKIYGFNAAKKLDSKLFNLMQSRKRTQRYLRDDTE
jgi:HPr kinase/phosphorylase